MRDPARAPSLPGAEVVQAAGYDDSEAMRRAFDGVDVLFLPSAGEHPDRVNALHRPAIEAAVAAGVERLVYTSFLGAAPDCTFTFGRDHFHTENLIREAGIGFTFLRDSIYLDFVPFFAGADGVIRGPAGDGRVAAVARDDIADVALAALLSDEHAGAAYELSGGEAFTMTEAAEIITRETGREVRFVNETLEEARESRRAERRAGLGDRGLGDDLRGDRRGRARRRHRPRRADRGPPADDAGRAAPAPPRELGAPPRLTNVTSTTYTGVELTLVA